MHRFLTLAAVAALALACQQEATEQAATTEPAVDVAAEEQALNALADRYEQEFAARNADALTGMYAPDAVWITHDGMRTEGAEAMRAQYAAMFGEPGDATIDIQPERIVVAASGDVAYTIGSATVSATGPDGQAIQQTTHHLVTFEKGEDGAWRITSGMDTAPVAAGEEATAAEGEAAAH